MAKERKFLEKEMTFAGFDFEVIFVKTSKNGIEAFEVFVLILREYDDVVYVHHTLMPFKASQNGVHDTLEGGWAILKTERHNAVFEEAIGGNKSSLVTVTLSQRDLPKSREEVECREECTASQ